MIGGAFFKVKCGALKERSQVAEGGTYNLPEHRETYVDDFGRESATLTAGNNISWTKNSERTYT